MPAIYWRGEGGGSNPVTHIILHVWSKYLSRFIGKGLRQKPYLGKSDPLVELIHDHRSRTKGAWANKIS